MNKMFKGTNNFLEGKVTDENTITIFDSITFEREDLDLEVDTDVILEFDPDAIEVVSIDHGDMKVFLESLIYKGAYNEMIVYSIEHSKEMILHSMLDEQVATDIGIRFKFDRFKITPVEKKTEV